MAMRFAYTIIVGDCNNNIFIYIILLRDVSDRVTCERLRLYSYNVFILSKERFIANFYPEIQPLMGD